MQKTRAFFWFWLPAIVWMVLIFGGSGDTASTQHSSRILEPILHWLFPNMSQARVEEYVFGARKCAHLTEYGILALLCWRAWRHLAGRVPHTWRWSDAGWAMVAAILYAATDEYHQTFVPNREGCVRDVIIDGCGAAAALLLLWWFGRWRKWW